MLLPVCDIYGHGQASLLDSALFLSCQHYKLHSCLASVVVKKSAKQHTGEKERRERVTEDG